MSFTPQPSAELLRTAPSGEAVLVASEIACTQPAAAFVARGSPPLAPSSVGDGLA
jgi:hypothetical protein